MPQLIELGERRIVREILPKFVVGIGSDCATVAAGSGTLVITTDPVPEPAAKVLAGDPDPYWMGWLLVVINASDIAASGAEPLAFLAAVEAPAALQVSDLERFLEGVRDACLAEGLPYVGGNMREAQRFTATGTAVGLILSGVPVTRQGATAGDLLVSVGQGGVFWRDIFLLRESGVHPDRALSPVFRPRSQLECMAKLRSSNLVRAAMDVSDGLLPTLTQLAEDNGVQVQLELDQLRVPGATAHGIDPARLWMGWGDWNVVAAIPEHLISSAMRAASEARTPLIPIGRLAPGSPEVLVLRNGACKPAPRLESERFAKDSWFSIGIEAYVQAIRDIELL